MILETKRQKELKQIITKWISAIFDKKYKEIIKIDNGQTKVSIISFHRYW